MSNATYETAVSSTIAAVKNELTSVNKWQDAGQAIRSFFGTEAALVEIKAQFIADAIIPALDKKYAAALAAELPRKGSKEYNALDASGVARWDAANKAKKDARAVSHTMFSRVVSYAFPKDKETNPPRTLKTRLCEDLAAMIKACEKSEDADFDIAATLNHLRAALAVVAK